MESIMNDLARVSARLSEPSFLANKGLSNEVGIHVFCYEPKDELTVSAYFDNLKKQNDVPYRLIERNLYKIFLSVELVNSTTGKSLHNSFVDNYLIYTNARLIPDFVSPNS